MNSATSPLSRAVLRSLAPSSRPACLVSSRSYLTKSSLGGTPRAPLSQLQLSSHASSVSPGVSRLARSRNFSTTASAVEKKYTEEHEWVELSEDGTECTIGVTEYAAKALGDVVYVELPVADLEVNAGDAIGAVESVKSASDIYSPLAGTVIKANSVLEETPGTINKSPEHHGWIAKVKLSEGEADKLADLMDAAAYAKHTEE